jgi:acetyl esterase/lipase
MAGWRRARSGDENTVAAVVSWSGPLNLYTVAEQSPMVLSAVSPHLREDRYRALLAANRDAVALASPVSYLDSGAPPSFIANGRSEVIPASVAEEAAAELARLGVSHELRLYPRGHALGFTSVALGPSIAFLERHLRC